MKLTCKLGFIGGGNMAHALIIGLKNQGFDTGNITVVELEANKRAALEASLGVATAAELASMATMDAIILAVKPQQLASVAKQLQPFLSTQLVISIAAGIRLNDLSRWLGGYQTIIRTMPNTPAQIQAGITGMFATPQVSAAQKQLADKLLCAAGSTVWVDSEQKLDAVTAISGSGPAYVFYLIEALQQAAINLGLSEAEAKQLSIATFKGASLLADVSSTPVAELREQVTSKGGTTEQGLLSLQKSEVNLAINRAAEAANARAKTLGDELGIN